MDHHFGTKWRSGGGGGGGGGEKVFYSTRKTIIDHIEDRRRGGEDLDAILDSPHTLCSPVSGPKAVRSSSPICFALPLCP
jgi:hypothetical protein